MTKGEKIILGILIALLALGAVLWKRQTDLMRRQRGIERQQQRNPFMEPATNSTGTAPNKTNTLFVQEYTIHTGFMA